MPHIPPTDAHTRWYYADANNQPVGPVAAGTRSLCRHGAITLVKQFVFGLLIAFGLSTLRADDTKPLAERLANTKWSMDSDSTMDPSVGWFMLNSDMTTRAGWHKEVYWWKVVDDSRIAMRVTQKDSTRHLTFNKDLTEATDAHTVVTIC